MFKSIQMRKDHITSSSKVVTIYVCVLSLPSLLWVTNSVSWVIVGLSKFPVWVVCCCFISTTTFFHYALYTWKAYSSQYSCIASLPLCSWRLRQWCSSWRQWECIWSCSCQPSRRQSQPLSRSLPCPCQGTLNQVSQPSFYQPSIPWCWFGWSYWLGASYLLCSQQRQDSYYPTYLWHVFSMCTDQWCGCCQIQLGCGEWCFPSAYRGCKYQCYLLYK